MTALMSKCTYLWLILAFILSLSHAQRDLAENGSLLSYQGHFQSGPDTQGSSFAATAQIDATANTLTLIGTTYGSWWSHDSKSDASSPDSPACFFAVAQLPGPSYPYIQWIHTQILGTPSVTEQCHGLLLDNSQNHLYVVGNSEPPSQGLLGSLFNEQVIGAEDVVQSGMILDYSLDSNPTPQSPLQLIGGRVEQEFDIQYPVAITSRPGTDKIFVATMLTDDTQRNERYISNPQNSQDGSITMVDPTSVMTYGSDYTMYIRMYTKKDTPAEGTSDSVDPNALERTLSPGISKEFATDDGEPVFISGMIQMPSQLIVVGNTEGRGLGFFSTQGDQHDLDNMDGFVTLLDVHDLNHLATLRLASGEDDYITGLCGLESSPEHVYVTGYTKGSLLLNSTVSLDNESIRGFLAKINVLDMSSPVWVTEFEAEQSTGAQQARVSKAISCAVAQDGMYVHVAGEVGDDGTVVGDPEAYSAGGTDIWVAQLEVEKGNVVFMKQMGSPKDDTIAVRGGVHVDTGGNAIVIGNTNGDIYRSRDEQAENENGSVFMTTFELNTGNFILPLDHPDFVSLPPQATKPPVVTPPILPEDDEDSGGDKSIGRIVSLVFFIGTLFFFVAFFALCKSPRRYRQKTDANTDRGKVLHYLHEFDIEDVDLKHSATGGWRCTYAGELADGINNHEPSGYIVKNLRYSRKDPLRLSTRSARSEEPFCDEFSVAQDGTSAKHKDQSRFLGLINSYADHYTKFANGGVIPTKKRVHVEPRYPPNVKRRDGNPYSIDKADDETLSSNGNNSPASILDGVGARARSKEKWDNEDDELI